MIIDNSFGEGKEIFRSTKCFYCGLQLSVDEGFVHWGGYPGDNLDLHRDCANNLAVNLIQDSIKNLKTPLSFKGGTNK
jgi:hypothetical protein